MEDLLKCQISTFVKYRQTYKKNTAAKTVDRSNNVN